ncbi:ATPase [Antribacter gilvus]|uniref:ATPase n=1 Tax=Antribacter gilvus TaxID=2304675 RepID=UPI001F0B7B7B|nr:ATPase [Antribacter gilvus]
MSTDTVPLWPHVQAVVREDGTGEVVVDGTPYPVFAAGLEEARVEVLRRVTLTAAQVGRAVRATAEGPEGVWALIVHPDGTVVPQEAAPRPAPAEAAVAVPSAGAPAQAPDPALPLAPAPAPAQAHTPEPVAVAAPVPGTVPVPAQVGPGPTSPPTFVQTPAPDGMPDGMPVVDGVPRPAFLEDDRTEIDDATVPGLAAPATAAPASAPAAPAPAAPAAAAPGVADWVRHGVPAAQPAPAQPAPAQPAPAQPGYLPLAATVLTVSETPEATETTSGSPRTRREARQSFLQRELVEEPAARGVRGALARVGIRLGPSEAERAERDDERSVSQHWPGPRTVAVVNGKGGAGKTPSTVLLAAVFARYGGAGVVTWDNNQTRGTLGWRTEQGPHGSTLLDLLPQTDRLLGTSAQAADLARFVHHQTRDKFDVLRSKPMALAHEQRVEPEDVDAIHSVLSKYYRMIFIDSGNDESDPMWLRMIDLTDQLVVATTTRDDHAEAGALLLEALAARDGRSAYLAQQAVTVVSQADPKASPDDVRRVADGYSSLARDVVTIPFDPAMVDGHLRFGALRPATQRAWLGAGAAVAGGL